MKTFMLSTHLGLSGVAAAALMTLAPTAATAAQRQEVSVPALPLVDALRQIAAQTGSTINVDPDAVAGLTSRAVSGARNAEQAVRRAVGDLPVAITRNADGSITVGNEILVVARRDEAETSVLVRSTSTSSRLGQSLRDQARNTQVISAKLLEQQQARTLSEALANAGGVVVNSTNLENGVNYSVRGFSSNGSVNGLPTASSSTFAAGTSQPLANVERIEVLKGPDAILLGGDNLGGTVNIVTKKPDAEERLYVSADTGSFGTIRGTVDANRAISDNDRFTARIVATAATADHNFGGYRGNEDYLFAPSLRYKNGVTDAIVSISLSNQIFGTAPYAILNPKTGNPFPFPIDKPIMGPRNQFTQIGTTQFNGELTQKITDWLTAVVRGQHQHSTFGLTQYSPYIMLDPNGLLLVSSLGVRQRASVDAVDGYLRATFNTGPVSHKIVAGHTQSWDDVTADGAKNGDFAPYGLLTGQPPLPPLANNYGFANALTSHRKSYYAQYLVGLGPIHLLAGVRRNDATITSTVGTKRPVTDTTSATTPNYGAVVDVTGKLSVFGTLAYGFLPTFTLDRAGNRLPDVHTRNAETGIKWDLFGNRALLNASWFKITQSNLIVTDPANPRYQIALPGQQGTGIDLNLSGEPVPGLSVVAAFTRTEYKYLRPVITLGNIVNAQPRDSYSLYASYKRKVAEKVTAGLGAGVSGRSSSSVDRVGTYYIPGSVQADLNGFLTVGKLDVNIGVRNLFDRFNLLPTIGSTYVPIGETRTWRLTVGYRFR